MLPTIHHVPFSLLVAFLVVWTTTTFSPTTADSTTPSIDSSQLFESNNPRITTATPPTHDQAGTPTFSFQIKGVIKPSQYSKVCITFTQDTVRIVPMDVATVQTLKSSSSIHQSIQRLCTVSPLSTNHFTATHGFNQTYYIPMLEWQKRVIVNASAVVQLYTNQQLQAMAVARWSPWRSIRNVLKRTVRSNYSIVINHLRHDAQTALKSGHNGKQCKQFISNAETLCIHALVAQMVDVSEANITTIVKDVRSRHPRSPTMLRYQGTRKNQQEALKKSNQIVLPQLFAQVIGERSKYWELLGHVDTALNSYKFVRPEIDKMYELSQHYSIVPPAHRIVPGWIRLNNATTLPRILGIQRGMVREKWWLNNELFVVVCDCLFGCFLFFFD
jgi:hypothetical protein